MICRLLVSIAAGIVVGYFAAVIMTIIFGDSLLPLFRLLLPVVATCTVVACGWLGLLIAAAIYEEILPMLYIDLCG